MNENLQITLQILGYIAIPVGVFYALRLICWLYKRYLRYAQSKFYRRDEYVTIRMRVPRNNEKGPLVMEQIFASLYGVFKMPTLLMTWLGFAQDKFSFEIVNKQGRIYFYVHTHKRLRRLIEGQFYAQYPGVEIEEVEDYLSGLEMAVAERDDLAPKEANVMTNTEDASQPGYTEFLKVNPLEHAVTAEMNMFGAYLWPIKTHKEFNNIDDKTIIDPLSSVTTSISTLNFPSDIAAIQYVIRPANHLWQKFGWNLFNNYLRKGFFRNPPWFMDWFIQWYSVPSMLYHFFLWFPIQVLKIFWFLIGKVKPIENLNALERQEIGFTIWEVPKKKLTTLGFQTDIRLLYVPMNADVGGAYNKIKEMSAGFNQFQYPYVNGFSIARVGNNKDLMRRFQERDFYERLILGIDELATIFHLPILSLETPNIQWVLSKKLEPPTDLPRPGKSDEEVTVIGKTNFRGVEETFGIKSSDRRRHIYIIGKTGMGKSTLLENMIYSDVHAGKAVAVIDPHGDLADYVVSIVPASRTNDVIFFNPADRDFPISFNMLEVTNPDHRNLVASGLLGIFKKMYAESWGPRLEHILRNTILALTEYPGATMLGIMRILIDPVYREKVVEKVTDPVVRSFWIDEFGKMDAKFRTEAIAPIQNKVGQFLSSPIVRNILGQPKSSLNIRYAMDSGKIIIVNLSKGRIGEDNSSLLGSMLVTKFQLDAMSRADIPEPDRKDFYLYVDEFQNFATDSFATILSEARKYRLNLTMANQYIAQMSEEVQAAVFGNVGSVFTFQVGYDDADYMAKQFADEEMVNDILSLEKYTGYMRVLIDNMPSKPFSVRTLASPKSDKDADRINKIINASRERYSNERLMVEDKIKRWSEASQNALADSKKLPPGVVDEDDLRHEKNKDEFEQVLTDAGLTFKIIPKESYEVMGIDKATNEYVYYLERDGKGFYCFSSLDPQGNCFKKKRSEMIRFFEQDEKTKMFIPRGNKVQKSPYWKHYLRQALEEFGAKEYDLPQGVPENEEYDYRHSGNRKEFEEVMQESNIKFELIPREKYDKFGIPKSVNEHVYITDRNPKEKILIYSSVDPQGDVFRKKKFDSIKFVMPGDTKKAAQLIKELARDVRWKKSLRKQLGELDKL